MATTNSPDLESDARSIVGVREFDAPRDLVFAAFTDPKHLSQWWGPDGFTTTTSSFDMRPGGVWRFVMHGPDGRDYQNRITYEEIVPPERIVYRHGGGADVEPVQFRQTIVFEDLGRRTRITWRGDFPSAAERDRVIKEYGADKGLMQTLARLAEYMAAMASSLNQESSMQVQPYLSFEGRCDEAIEFYKKSIGAKVEMLMRFKDAPDQSMISPGSADKVMHASLRAGDATLLMSDGRCTGSPNFHGIALALSASTDADAERIFNALVEGGKVNMPMTKTFFSSRFGMLSDKFGVGWMVLVQ